MEIKDKNKTRFTSYIKLNRSGLPAKNLGHFHKGYEFIASITHVSDYKNLVFYICEENEYPRLSQFRISTSMQAISEISVPRGVFCILNTKTTDEAQVIWRAIVKSVENNGIKKETFLIDYGETVFLNNGHKLYKLPKEYQNIPPLAIKCVLNGSISIDGIMQTNQNYLEHILHKSAQKMVRFRVSRCLENVLYLILLESVLPTQVEMSSKASSSEHNRYNMFGTPEFLNAVIGEKVPPILPKEEKLKMIVTHVVSPIVFYAVLDSPNFFWSDDEISILQKGAPIVPKINDVIVSRYLEDGFWYRAKVFEIDEEKQMYKVFYIDYGNTELVPLSRLANCPIEPDLIPPYAIRCRLANLIDVTENQTYKHRKLYKLGKGTTFVILLNQVLNVKVISRKDGELIVCLLDSQYADLPSLLLQMGVVRKVNN